MRDFLLGFLALLVTSLVAPSAGVITKAQAGRITAPTSLLQLTAAIGSQRYCKEDGDYDSLGLKLRLRFKNVGDQKVILYKGSESVIRTTVGPSIEDVESGRLLSDIKFSVYTQGGYKIDTPSPGQAFIILPPDGTFEKETETVVMVAKKAGAGAVLPGGKYYVQVTVSTFPETQDLARELRRRWAESGVLCFDPIQSQPIRLNVPASWEKSIC
jgi:hypothetical protein